MMTESEIKMYSDKYAKMREHSVLCFGGSYFDYDARNDVILNRFSHIIMFKVDYLISTTNNIELQCLRYLAMRELAYRTEEDGNKHLKLKSESPKRKLMNQFDELAENPYYFHQFGVRECFMTSHMKSNKAYKKQMIWLSDEAAPTIN